VARRSHLFAPARSVAAADRVTSALAGLLRMSASFLPAARREWAEAVLAETGEVPARAGRLAWLCGGLWLVAREVLMSAVVRVLAFAAGVTGLVWIGWPGPAGDSALPVNRMYVVGTVLMLAVLPVVVRHLFGPVRSRWTPRAARIGCFAMVLVLVAAKNSKDRFGNKLGHAYFAFGPGHFFLQVLLLLIIGAYVAGVLILTTERVQLTRAGLPIALALGIVTGGFLYALAPFGGPGIDPSGPTLPWWGLAALTLPAMTGLVAGRLAARDPRPSSLDSIQQGTVAAICAMASAALVVSVLTLVTIALFPHRVPLEGTTAAGGGPAARYIASGGCMTCWRSDRQIPRDLRHEYWLEVSVSQAHGLGLPSLLLGPLIGAGIGVFAAGLGTRRRGADGRIVYGRDAAALPVLPPSSHPLGSPGAPA
jgi:hypothetical protein